MSVLEFQCPVSLFTFCYTFCLLHFCISVIHLWPNQSNLLLTRQNLVHNFTPKLRLSLTHKLSASLSCCSSQNRTRGVLNYTYCYWGNCLVLWWQSMISTLSGDQRGVNQSECVGLLRHVATLRMCTTHFHLGNPRGASDISCFFPPRGRLSDHSASNLPLGFAESLIFSKNWPHKHVQENGQCHQLILFGDRRCCFCRYSEKDWVTLRGCFHFAFLSAQNCCFLQMMGAIVYLAEKVMSWNETDSRKILWNQCGRSLWLCSIG